MLVAKGNTTVQYNTVYKPLSNKQVLWMLYKPMVLRRLYDAIYVIIKTRDNLRRCYDKEG